MIFYGNILSDELAGVVVMVDVIPVSRVPVMAVTRRSPNFPFLTASRSIERTSVSLTVELNSRARSTITHPHLGRKREKLSSNWTNDQKEEQILSLRKFSDCQISPKTKPLNKYSGLLFISEGNRMNTGAVNVLHYEWKFSQNCMSLMCKFERIFKYHEQCKSARAFISLLIYYMTGKITKAGALICTAVQIKN